MNLSSIGFTASALKNPETPLRFWYVSSSYTGATQDGGISTPWTALTQVNTAGNDGTIQPGDAILFKRGDTFYCRDREYGFRWWNGWGGLNCVSGTASKAITFSNYGTGALPNFLFPWPSTGGTSGATVDVRKRIVLSFENSDNIIIDGLQFSDPRYPTVFKVDEAYTATAIMFGENSEALSCNHNIVRNCYFNNISNAITYCGDYNEIYDNTMENFGNLYAYTVNSYGANGVTMTGNYNYVHNNYIKGAWAWADTFGTNGGALELYEQNNYNNIMFNTFVDCGGIAEMGGSSSAQTLTNNIFAYNKIINCGSFSYASVSGQFAVTVRDNKFYNNVFVENVNSRFSGPNFGSGFTQFPTFSGCASGFPYSSTACLPQPSDVVFSWGAGLTATTAWDLKDNIFCLLNQPTTFQKNGTPFSASGQYTLTMVTDSTKVIHQYNRYYISGGSINYTLGTGEASGSTTVFLNSSSSNPENWNFKTISGYTGISVDLALDFSGVSVTNPPYIGIFNS
jgi:hypothetical protein